MARNTAVARRYAAAFVGTALTKTEAGLEQATKELESFWATMTASKELSEMLLNPVFTAQERHRILQAVLLRMGLSAETQRFLLLLAERNRFHAYEEVVKAARRLTDARANRIEAEVRAAAPLSKDAQESLRRALERRTGKTVHLNIQVDPSLLGGVRTTIGSTVLDGTLRAQLDQLRDRLLA